MRDGRLLLTPTAFLLAGSLFLAALAVAQPFAVAAFSVLILGPLHVLLASRYLAGRGLPALSGAVGRTVALAVMAMTLVRVVAVIVPDAGRVLELFGSWAIVGFAVWVGLRGRLRLLGLAAALMLALLSLAELPAYWHLLTHGHNLIPLIFLWDWARRFSPTARLAFVACNLVWVLGIPVLLLTGLLDPLLNPTVPAAVSGLTDPGFLLGGAAPAGATQIQGLRYLAVFCFLQLMHYALWMVFFQICGRPETRRLAERFPAVAGWRFWAAAATVSVLVWGAYAIGYQDGRATYAVLGALNVYLEQPLAIWLLLTALPTAATTPLVARLRLG